MSISPACSQALGLPEIVAAILEQLRDYKALFAAVQVSRLWADEATTILWRETPPIQDIVHICDVERLQYYANKVRFLGIPRVGNEWSQILKLRFPRLRVVSTDITDHKDEQSLLPYMQPNIHHFQCVGGPISDSFWMQIESRCPDLRSLGLSNFKTTDICGLLRFLEGMPSLKDLHLWYGPEDVDLYLHLASRPSLQRLSMPRTTLTVDKTMTILANVTNPYPKLEWICWSSQSRAFQSLARHLSSLNFLCLILVDASDDVLFAISSCINLGTVKVYFEKDSHVPAEGLLAIARKCPHLRHFSLGVTKGIKVDGRSITDDIVRQVAAYLPAMTSFELVVETDLTITALLCLGDLSAGLEACNLNGDFNLEELWRPNLAPLFPRLMSLKLCRVSMNIPYERAVSILNQQAPKLNLAVTNAKSGSADENWDRSIQKIQKKDGGSEWLMKRRMDWFERGRSNGRAKRRDIIR